MQITELHYRRPPQCTYAEVKARAQEILGNELDSAEDEAFLIFHPHHAVQYSDGEVPPQTAILSTDSPPKIETYDSDIQQSRGCPNASDLLRSCTETRLVTELMAWTVPPHDRIQIFHGVLQAMVELTEPAAMVFKHSQQVIHPSDYLTSCD